jgi:alpha-L-rhamnosidase
MMRVAEALGLEGDACTYRALAAQTAAAFHRRFYDAGSGSYGPVGGNVFALVMGVPAERLQRVRAALASDIAANGGHLDTGIFGTGFLFEVLSDNGLNDLAYRVMDKKTCPSFGWWIEQGWTTTSEYWEGLGSRNHPMFGGGLSWFYRRLVGLGEDERGPGYRRLVIHPRPAGEPKRASYATRTPYGELSVSWVKCGRVFELKTEIPVGSTALVVLPCRNAAEVCEGGLPLSRVTEVRVRDDVSGDVSLEVASGRYTFTVPCPEP